MGLAGSGRGTVFRPATLCIIDVSGRCGPIPPRQSACHTLRTLASAVIHVDARATEVLVPAFPYDAYLLPYSSTPCTRLEEMDAVELSLCRQMHVSCRNMFHDMGLVRHTLCQRRPPHHQTMLLLTFALGLCGFLRNVHQSHPVRYCSRPSCLQVIQLKSGWGLWKWVDSFGGEVTR